MHCGRYLFLFIPGMDSRTNYRSGYSIVPATPNGGQKKENKILLWLSLTVIFMFFAGLFLKIMFF